MKLKGDPETYERELIVVALNSKQVEQPEMMILQVEIAEIPTWIDQPLKHDESQEDELAHPLRGKK